MWTFKYADDKVLSFDDLPPATYQKIATKHDLFWLNLWSAPGSNVEALYDLVVARAELEGITPPQARDMHDIRDLIDRLENQEVDDRPKVGTTPESPDPIPDDPETT